MTLEQYSTDNAAAPHRAAAWSSIIAETYFPLHLSFRSPETFRGRFGPGGSDGCELPRADANGASGAVLEELERRPVVKTIVQLERPLAHTQAPIAARVREDELLIQGKQVDGLPFRFVVAL